MRCTYFRVRGYNRFDLGHIRELIITPESLIQLVLGTNGAGKSSLLALLLPTVPERSDFDGDGEYEFHCEHRGKNYRLLSRLKAGFKHEFYVDDSDNLNVGGTGPTQWHLINEHFETNDDWNRLMLGYETAYKFTEMAPMKRREWLTKICPVNVEFALQLFQIVKQQVRNLKAINDHSLGKLLVSRTKLEEMMLEYTPEKLQDAINKERVALEGMMGLPLYDSTTDSTALYCMATDARQFIHELITQITRYRGKSTAAETRIRDEIKNELLKARSKLDAQAEELMHLSGILQSVKEAGADDIASLRSKLDQLKAERDECKVDPSTIPADLNPLVAESDFNAVSDSLQQLMMNWVDTDNTFTVSDAKASFDRVESMERTIRGARNRLADLEQHLEHFSGSPETTCPSCNHRFIVGMQPGQSQADFEARVAKGRKWLEDNVPIYEAEKAKLDLYRQWDRDISVLTDLSRSRPGIKCMWDELFAHGRTKGYGHSALALLSKWETLFSRWARWEEYNREVIRLERMLEQIGNVDLQPTIERHDRIQANRVELLDTIDKLTGELTKTEDRLNAIMDINDRILRAEEMEEMIKHTSTEYVRYLFTRTVREAMATTIRNINEAEQTLNSMKSDMRLVAELEQTQLETETNLKFAELVMAELSPSNGLIADTLAGPINGFIEYMNGIMEPIWEYDLRVLPCAVDASGLNYRFPIHSEKSIKPRKDIVQASRGQKELINQAFIIAMMHYKGFTDWPLLLDEFASGFDPQHQTNAMDFVRSLVDTQRVSQIWFISHYVINHSSFNTAQACVLDKSNIILPEKYNEHVQLL